MGPGRVGVIHPYWRFWEDAAGGDLRATRTMLGARAERAIAASATVAWSLTVEPQDEPPVPGGAVDAIVVVVTIASPPTAVLRLLQAHPRASVVLWALTDGAPVGPDFGHGDIAWRGATVGVPMIGAALAASGRPFEVLVAGAGAGAGGVGAGDDGGRESVARAVRGAVAAGRVRRGRIGLVGSPLAGYGFTALPAEALVRLGTQVVPIDEDLVSADVRTTIRGTDGIGAAATRSRSWCTVLDLLVRDHDLQAGSLNCHSAALRRHPEIGTAPCFALGESTSRGVPWTCTGDVATAFAMLVVASLGAPTLYHEIEAVDEARDVALLANSGEHDTRFSLSGTTLGVNPWFPGPPDTLVRTGAVSAGPAALVAARADRDSVALVVADGRFTGEVHPATGTVNAAFRFGSGPVGPAWRRWAETGVGHHSCATDRPMAQDIGSVALHLGVRSVVV